MNISLLIYAQKLETLAARYRELALDGLDTDPVVVRYWLRQAVEAEAKADVLRAGVTQ